MSWRELEMTDFAGMATNIAKPDRRESILNRNLDVHEKPGTLTLRPGYELKYSRPYDARIQSGGFVSFANFYDKSADPDGKEITVLIQKGVVKAEDTAISDTQTQPNFWVRPYWDSLTSEWVDDWQWLNEVVITTVKTASNSTTPSMLEINAALEDDYFVGWTMWNKTQNIVSQIITSKLITGGNRINHTLYNSSYNVADIIYLFKNYINPTYLEEMNNATAQEIVYHHVLNDIRIGFGGKENRVGISIGYRKKYFKIKEFFPTGTLHTDLDADALEAYSKIDGLILDEYSFVSKPYGIDLTEDSTGTLASKTYYFRLTGLLDDNSELLLSENTIKTTTGKRVIIKPYFNTGKHNKRITDFKVYYGTDGETYHKLFEYGVSSSERMITTNVIDINGLFILSNDLTLGSLYGEDSAASPADSNNLGSWRAHGTSTVSVDSTNKPAGENYSIKALSTQSGGDYIIVDIEGVKNLGEYNVDLQIDGSVALSADVYFANSKDPATPLSNVEDTGVAVGWGASHNVLNSYSTDIDILVFEVTYSASGETYNFDKLVVGSAIKPILEDTTTAGTEISAEMGYTPSYNLVKDWEQCLVFNGRGHYLNPFIEKKWDNFIMKSAISAGWMYDAVTAGTYLELDKFDGSKSVGMALLSNSDLLILKDQSTMIIDPDTNFTRDFGRGKGCIARETIVTLANAIIWCGLEDIYMITPSGSLDVKGLLSKTIRDIYLADKTLSKAIAIRDKYNNYRFRLYNPDTKKEYLLTERGWVEEVKYLFVNMYRIGYNNQIWFMNNGALYAIDKELDYPSIFDVVATEEIPI